MFATWGRFIYRFRWYVLIASILMLPASVMLQSFGGNWSTSGESPKMESWRAFKLMDKQLPASPVSFSVIFTSKNHTVSQPAFRSEVNAAIADLRPDRHVANIQTAFDLPPAVKGAYNPQMVSRDHHSALAVVNLHGKLDTLIDVYPSLAGKVHSGSLQILRSGDLPQGDDGNKAATKDLSRALIISLPIVLLLLLFVFGSMIAAGLPLGVGILAVMGATAATLLLARMTDVMSAASEVVIMIGLGVAIDYSLFIVNRFREEIEHRPVADALGRTMATAGRAILFSGCTVAIGLLGLTFFHFGAIGSIGVAGTFAVALSVIYAFTFLPALLAILGHRVNKARMPFVHPERHASGSGFWHGMARTVMNHPWKVLIPTLMVLILFAFPVLHMRMSWGDYTSLPKGSESRNAAEMLTKEFPGGTKNEITAVIQYDHGSPLYPERVGKMVAFSRWLAHLPNVTGVDSIVDVNPGMSAAGYQQLYSRPLSQLPSAAQASVQQNVGKGIVVFHAYTPLRSTDERARDIVRTIRQHHPNLGGNLLVGGMIASDIDGIDEILSDSPMAIAFIVIATYIVLFLLLGSVILPLKAIVMNLLSATASYGVLVWVFQDGHLSGLLGFTPNPIQIWLPIVLFCILFGLSMDYEVFLLTRFKENYDRTGSTEDAVALGLERTGRLVTGAALIMITVFYAYTTSSLTDIKALGVGLGTAILVDALIVRSLLVPATMRILGEWNWWAPAPLARLYARLNLSEESVEEEITTAPAMAAE